MIRKRNKVLFIILSLLFFSLGAEASESARAFIDGLKAYEESDFDTAIEKFTQIAENGVVNGKLFYNLGNAFLKSGDMGRAMLWYERAHRLIPSDPDLKFNREYALSLTKDEKEEQSVWEILFFWKHVLGAQAVQWIGILLNAVFWLMLSFRIYKKKKLLGTAPLILLLVTLVFTATAFYNYYENACVKKGIILPKEVSVRSGLEETSTELFKLHAGTRVDIQKETEGYYRIYFSDGKIGWVKKTDAGVI